MFSSLKKWLGRTRGGLLSPPASKNLLLLILRGLFIALTIAIGTGSLYYFDQEKKDFTAGLISFATALTLGFIIIGIDLLARNKQITTISAVYFGLLMGFLLGSFLWLALEPVVILYLDPRLLQLTRLFITVVACYVSVSLLLQTKDEFRFIIPYVEFSRQVKGPKPLVLDTSVIIDGRIADICETGIIDTRMIVPRFVLQELQGIADSSDKIKRNRGRRGLDILKRIQTNPRVEVVMQEGNLPELREIHKVDERLVVLAKSLGARVVTTDFNLNKISQLQGVEVINVNELSNALKVVALPGENLAIKVVKQGDQPGQGVGYLEDGTMVVIEQGRTALGQEVNVTVTSVLQTPAGRMIFARLESRTPEGRTSQPASTS